MHHGLLDEIFQRKLIPRHQFIFLHVQGKVHILLLPIANLFNGKVLVTIKLLKRHLLLIHDKKRDLDIGLQCQLMCFLYQIPLSFVLSVLQFTTTDMLFKFVYFVSVIDNLHF